MALVGLFLASAYAIQCYDLSETLVDCKGAGQDTCFGYWLQLTMDGPRSYKYKYESL